MVDADSPAIRYVGRFDFSNPKAPEFAWPGSSISLRFTGTSVSVKLTQNSDGWEDDSGHRYVNEYDVYVDGTLQPTPLTTALGEHTFALASELPDAVHEVRLVKRTEAAAGSAGFDGFVVDANATLEAPVERARRLEFVGDSITAGYGDLGADGSCTFTPATEDVDDAYALLTADALGAEAVVEAYQGRGVYRNADVSDPETLPLIYDRVIPDDSGAIWSVGTWFPDAVVINLGTNDFASGDPGSGFVSSMEALVERLRGQYPRTLVVLALGPMLGDDYPAGQQQLTTARGYLTTVVADEHGKGDANVTMIEFPEQDGSLGYGCDWHPSKATQASMAEQLEGFLKTELGW